MAVSTVIGFLLLAVAGTFVLVSVRDPNRRFYGFIGTFIGAFAFLFFGMARAFGLLLLISFVLMAFQWIGGNFRRSIGGVAAGFLLLFSSIAGAVALSDSWNEDTRAAANAPVQPVAEDEEVAVSTGNSSVNLVVDAASMAPLFEGAVHPDELAFGDEAVALMAGAPEERGGNAHSPTTLRSPQELTAALNSGDPKMAPVRDRVVNAITQTCGVEDVAVHLDQSQGWLLMVVIPESQVHGTSYSVDGQMQFATDWRQTGERDAYWLPVCTTGANAGKVVIEGIVRADCGNGHKSPKIRIVRQDTPPAPPVETPPTTTTTTPPTTVPPGTPPSTIPPDQPRCPYDHRLPPDCKVPTEDVLVNPGAGGSAGSSGGQSPQTPVYDDEDGIGPGSVNPPVAPQPSTPPSGGGGSGSTTGGNPPPVTTPTTVVTIPVVPTTGSPTVTVPEPP